MSLSTYRIFARGSAFAFALVALYTIVVKLPQAEPTADATHTLLHIASGAVAVYAGWFSKDDRAATALALLIGVVYGIAGIAGWFVDGLLMDTRLAIPLGPADNVFHLVLAAAAAFTVATGRRVTSLARA